MLMIGLVFFVLGLWILARFLIVRHQAKLKRKSDEFIDKIVSRIERES